MSKQKPRAAQAVKMLPVGTETLKEIRESVEPHKLYGRDAAACETVVAAVLDPVMAGAPVSVGTKYQFRWYMAELVRLFRTRNGYELALHVEMVVQKWHTFGLDDEMMQWLVRQVWQRVKSEPAAV